MMKIFVNLALTDEELLEVPEGGKRRGQQCGRIVKSKQYKRRSAVNYTTKTQSEAIQATIQEQF